MLLVIQLIIILSFFSFTFYALFSSVCLFHISFSLTHILSPSPYLNLYVSFSFSLSLSTSLTLSLSLSLSPYLYLSLSFSPTLCTFSLTLRLFLSCPLFSLSGISSPAADAAQRPNRFASKSNTGPWGILLRGRGTLAEEIHEVN